MSDESQTPLNVSLPSSLTEMGGGVVGTVISAAAAAAQALINAIAAGDVKAVEQLSKVLPTPEQIEARALALRVQQEKAAADTLPP